MPDTRTTGVLAATASTVIGTLIANNHISNNHFGSGCCLAGAGARPPGVLTGAAGAIGRDGGS